VRWSWSTRTLSTYFWLTWFATSTHYYLAMN